jgi:hypothetical protein
MAWLAAHWSLFLCTALASSAYIAWKAKGGRLLFREHNGDDNNTKMMKGLAAFFFAYGAMMVAMWIAAISLVLLALAGIGALVS